MTTSTTTLPPSIAALLPRSEGGHQFVCYGDCCSGIPDGPHEATFASVNAVLARLEPQPEFVCFLGDEIKGLLADETALREQWAHWFEREMAWLDREAIPLYHTTGNHTTYNAASEAVFRAVLAHLPQNGPPGQAGLSYFVRRDDLLLVFVNTEWSGLGGDGRLELAWLAQVLRDHQAARHKLVLGHHPVYPINGFSGPYQRHLDAADGRAFWDILVRHGVLAYVCSHIMAFDVQAEAGVLQISTAGAGTLPLMPAETEYLHGMQMALDDQGLRYQVLDTAGRVREWLAWPLAEPAKPAWQPLAAGHQPAPPPGPAADQDLQAELLVWRIEGVCGPADDSAGRGAGQTFLCGWTPGPALGPWWLGLRGPDNRLFFLLSAEAGRSPHFWAGPTLPAGRPFSLEVAVHPAMGPGGMLWRWAGSSAWSSLRGATAWGAERFSPQARWSVGHDQYGPAGQPFRGQGLQVSWYRAVLELGAGRPGQNRSAN